MKSADKVLNKKQEKMFKILHHSADQGYSEPIPSIGIDSDHSIF